MHNTQLLDKFEGSIHSSIGKDEDRGVQRITANNAGIRLI